jgi:hypothetical protein
LPFVTLALPGSLFSLLIFRPDARVRRFSNLSKSLPIYGFLPIFLDFTGFPERRSGPSKSRNI